MGIKNYQRYLRISGKRNYKYVNNNILTFIQTVKLLISALIIFILTMEIFIIKLILKTLQIHQGSLN